MAAHSKLLYCSCHELGHPWTKSCGIAALEVAVFGYWESFKIYAPLYLVAAMVRKKNKEYFMKRLLPEILQSSAFLGTNAFMFIATFCAWRWLFGFYDFNIGLLCGIPACSIAISIERPERKVLGHFNFLSSCVLPALCACFFSIIIERKSRRGLLALYLANLATETLYRMAAFRGIVRPIQNGEVVLFSIVTSVYMYLYRQRNGLRDSVRSGIRFVVGGSEAGWLEPGPRPWSTVPPGVPRPRPAVTSSHWAHILPSQLQQLLNRWRAGSRHDLCRHRHSCLSTVFERGGRMFMFGYGVQGTIKLVSAMSRIWHRPKAVLTALAHPDNFHFAAFLGTFASVFQAVNCVMRWLRNDDSPTHGALAGFTAGWAMLFYKSSSIAMYLTSKLAEVLWFKGVAAGKLPLIKYADIIIYTLSTTLVFHAAVFECHNLRPAYWRFLTKLTHARFSEMDRKILDIYGTQASRLFTGVSPKPDPPFTGLRQFFTA